MSKPLQNLLRGYRYDAIDRLIACTAPDSTENLRFYCKDRLATETHGATVYSISQYGHQLLAQRQIEDAVCVTTLLTVDQQRSVNNTLRSQNLKKSTDYSPYGHSCDIAGLFSLLTFNGERGDVVTGWYLLGNGHRAYNPILMRFNSPDKSSPFKAGGLNSYAYCLNDPINRSDSSGQTSRFSSLIRSLHDESNDTRRQVRTRSEFRKQPLIRRRPSDPGPMTAQIVEPDFLGYHGTSRKSAKSLLKVGVFPSWDDEDRSGFFLTPDIEITYEYARTKQGIETNESFGPTARFGARNIVEVHVRNLTRMKPGKDYDYNHYRFLSSNPDRMGMEFFIRPHQARAVAIRRLGSTPPSRMVRPRSQEAPF